MTQDQPPSRPSRIRLWDAPVRIFHWVLVILIGFSWYSIEQGEVEWHQWSGLAILTLILFRITWGIVGSTTARFGQFVKGPVSVARYLKGVIGRAPEKYPGHNPAGGWMIMAMLLVLLAMPATGLFANDDIFFRGPLAYMVSKDVSDQLTAIHKQLFDVILILALLHIAAVIFYRLVLKDDLITPMITGRRPWTAGTPPALRFTNPVWALVLLMIAGGFVYWLIQ